MNLQLSRTTRVVLVVIATLVALWLIGPTLVVIALSFTSSRSWTFPPPGFSFQWYESFFSSSQWIGAFTNSIVVALLVVATTVLLATPAAYGLWKVGSSKLARVLQVTLISPMVIPPIILAIGIYSLFLRTHLVGTTAGFVAAHTMLALPYALISILASLATFDRQQELAAASLGANRLTGFLLVTLPGIVKGIASGGLFAFVISFDEVVVSLFVKDAFFETLPVRMYAAITRDTDPTLAAASTVILAFTTTIVVIFFSFLRRGQHDR